MTVRIACVVAATTAATLLPPTLHARESGPTDPTPFLGAWRAVEPPHEAWLFEEARAVRTGDRQPGFFRASWRDDGRVVLETSGIESELLLARDGADLWITVDEERRHFVAEDGVPDDLRVAPAPLGEARELDTERIAEIRVELADRSVKDQDVRRRLSEAGVGADGAMDGAIVSEMIAIDRENTAWLRTVIADVGWIDAVRFGPGAAGNAFLLVQHSGDLGLMQAVLPGIRADLERGAIDGGSFALLYDRLSLHLGRRQVFGSQLSSNPELGSFVLPLDDPDGVDERRAVLGMIPLAQYLEYFRDENGELPRHYEDGRSFAP